MKHCVAAVAVSLAVGLVGCDDKGGLVSEPAQVAATTPDPARESDHPIQLPGTSIPGAPQFVSLYPGAEVVMPDGASPARQITFTTDAPPDSVIAYYKERAESSGLFPTAAMNQGPARAYGASDRAESGTSLQVVASPTDDGLTAVQLNWSVQS